MLKEHRELHVQQEIAGVKRAAGVAHVIEECRICRSLYNVVGHWRSCRSLKELSKLHNVAGPVGAAGYIVGGQKKELEAVLAAVGCRWCRSLQKPKPHGAGGACYSTPWRAYRQYSSVKAMLYGWRPDRKRKHRASVKSPTLQFSPLQLREWGGREARTRVGKTES